jgi:hypothetical protein
MSRQITGTTDIRNRAILEQSLKEMSITYKELKEGSFQWGDGYDKMTINCTTGEIKYDEMRNSQLNQLKQTYSKNFILTEIAKKGHRVKTVKNVNGKIEINASY